MMIKTNAGKMMCCLSGKEHLCFLGAGMHGISYWILEKKTEQLSKIRQGPDEPYQNFVPGLLQVSHMMVDGEAETLIVKQLAYKNANAACHTAIHPCYNYLHADIGPKHTQGLTLAL